MSTHVDYKIKIVFLMLLYLLMCKAADKKLKVTQNKFILKYSTFHLNNPFRTLTHDFLKTMNLYFIV